LAIKLLPAYFFILHPDEETVGYSRMLVARILATDRCICSSGLVLVALARLLL
uniref:Rab-GAP TBC domain-containing protein n=1 Tax=Gongylonema pulchrum TaxID=637853 RepID=A0A183DBH7_9BILA